MIRKAVLNGVAEVERAAVLFRTTESRVDGLTDAEAEAQTTQDLASDRYTAGLVDFLEVTEARRQLLLIRRERVLEERDALLRLVDLYTALGGGWSSGKEIAASTPEAAAMIVVKG